MGLNDLPSDDWENQLIVVVPCNEKFGGIIVWGCDLGENIQVVFIIDPNQLRVEATSPFKV